jgi:predicted ATPase
MLVRNKGAWFAIQQPEVHLHPRAQAALGDLLFQMSELEQKHFVIETHSDFMVDRFRLNMQRTKQHKVKAQILFFERSGDGNKLTIIPIQSDGEYSPEQPKSFRDFFVKEQLSILGI